MKLVKPTSQRVKIANSLHFNDFFLFKTKIETETELSTKAIF